MRQLWILLVLAALAGCQLALPGAADRAGAGANPLRGDVITVTSLDAPVAEGAAPQAVDPEVALAEDAIPQTAPEIEPAPEAVVAVKTPMHLACERRGGRWSRAGSANASFCQTPTGEGARQCTKSSDCDGNCLAKSGTCAPYTPLLGCNDVLDAMGRMLTECIN